MSDKLPLTATRIGACVLHHAGLVPEQEAAVDRRTRVSYIELAANMTRWSKALLAAGISKGDRVAMLTPPCNEWLTVLLAVTDIGALWLGYHPRYRQPEFEHVTRLAEPKFVIAFRHIDGRDYSDELSRLTTQFKFIERLVVLDDDLHSGAVASFLEAGNSISDEALALARDAVNEDDTARGHLYLRHHRCAQRGDDQTSRPADRCTCGERTLADGPPATAAYDAGKSHCRCGHGGSFRSLRGRDTCISGSFRSWRVATAAGGRNVFNTCSVRRCSFI